jgi:hypothetical protein
MTVSSGTVSCSWAAKASRGTMVSKIFTDNSSAISRFISISSSDLKLIKNSAQFRAKYLLSQYISYHNTPPGATDFSILSCKTGISAAFFPLPQKAA